MFSGIFTDTFLIAQIFGFCAMVSSVMAWQLKDPRKIIFSYALIALLWGTQYYLLGAMAGVAICIFSCIKDLIVSQIHQKYGRIIILFFLILIFSTTVMIANSPLDFVPLLASSVYNIGLLFPDDRRVVARAGITHQGVWVVYNFFSGAHMGIICSILVSISTVISMVRYEKWQIGKCYRTFIPSVARSLFAVPSWRTYP